MDMKDFGPPPNSFLKAEGLQPNEVIEAAIKKVTTQSYPDGDKPILVFDDGSCERFVVLNQTRRADLIAAYGSESDVWIGMSVRVRRGEVIFAGNPVATVVLEPIVPPGWTPPPKK
jgi:hypothetical protein